MARASGVIVTGDKALDVLLKGLPTKVQKKVSRNATRKAAKEIVLPAARSRTPVDTGELEESLVVRAVKRSRTRFGHYVGTKEGHYRGDQFYGAFIEFGTKERRHKSGKAVGRIDPAKNFAYLRPAVYDNQPQIRAMYVDAMKQLINELAIGK
jgi:HK97 gp10 family phage protein